MFFNDAYQAILGETACARWLGRSGYEDEAYNGDIVRRKIEHIFETGEPSRVEDELVGDQLVLSWNGLLQLLILSDQR